MMPHQYVLIWGGWTQRKLKNDLILEVVIITILVIYYKVRKYNTLLPAGLTRLADQWKQILALNC